MAVYVVNEKTGAVSIKKGGNSVTLSHADFMEILHRPDDDFLLVSGKQLIVVNDDKEKNKYWLRQYGRDYSTAVFLTECELDTALDYATNISPPPVHDEICTLCDNFVGIGDAHYGCPVNCQKMILFSELFFGSSLIEVLVDMILDNSDDRLRNAYAAIKRHSVLKKIGLNKDVLCTIGPIPFQNENILRYDSYFKNFKICAEDIVYSKVLSV